jgi:hypothetical protein
LVYESPACWNYGVREWSARQAPAPEVSRFFRTSRNLPQLMHFAIRYYVCERTHVHKMITGTREVCGRQHNTWFCDIVCKQVGQRRLALCADYMTQAICNRRSSRANVDSFGQSALSRTARFSRRSLKDFLTPESTFCRRSSVSNRTNDPRRISTYERIRGDVPRND